MTCGGSDLHQIIERLPGTNTYRVTTDGIRVAVFYTKLRDRSLGPLLDADQPPRWRPSNSVHRDPVSLT